MHINPERLKARIDAINAMSRDESGGYTRLAFTEKDRQARAERAPCRGFCRYGLAYRHRTERGAVRRIVGLYGGP